MCLDIEHLNCFQFTAIMYSAPNNFFANESLFSFYFFRNGYWINVINTGLDMEGLDTIAKLFSGKLLLVCNSTGKVEGSSLSSKMSS